MAHILIVEDYPNIQQVYQTILESRGHEVVVATDGDEALQQTAKQQPDIILLDLLMAKVGGLEFLQRYKIADHPGTKVIVLSNLSSPELAQEAKQLGAAKYLLKASVTPEALLEEVEQTLGEKGRGKK